MSPWTHRNVIPAAADMPMAIRAIVVKGKPLEEVNDDAELWKQIIHDLLPRLLTHIFSTPLLWLNLPRGRGFKNKILHAAQPVPTVGPACTLQHSSTVINAQPREALQYKA